MPEEDVPVMTLKAADAIPHLREIGGYPLIMTSLPDAAEVNLTFPEWEEWFVNAAWLCLTATAEDGVTVFYQTDRRAQGRTLSKAAMIMRAIDLSGGRMLWHKIAVKTNSVSLFRPAYTHLIAASLKATSGRVTADVIPIGRKSYPNAMGHDVARLALDAVENTKPHGLPELLFDPFCGRGSILEAAAERGINGLGIDIDPTQVALTADRLRTFADVKVVSA